MLLAPCYPGQGSLEPSCAIQAGEPLLCVPWEDDSLPFFTVDLFLLQLKKSLF